MGRLLFHLESPYVDELLKGSVACLAFHPRPAAGAQMAMTLRSIPGAACADAREHETCVS